MEITTQHWGIIINPKSGKKKYRQQRKELFLLLKHHNIHFEYCVTRFAGHASKIAAAYVEAGYRNILILGGDGTISEAINGIFHADIASTRDIKIALIPRGTGNDWGRFWGITRNFKKSSAIFLAGKTKTIDIGKLNYTIEGKEETHYFINSMGIGLDAQVVNITNRLKKIFGSHSILYSIAILLGVFSYRASKSRVITGETTRNSSLYTMNIANGCYSGGGLKQTPDAIPFDGLFDVMMVEKPGILSIITGLACLFRGKLLEHPAIHSYRTGELYIQCSKSIQVEADGIIVDAISPFRVTVLPASIQMIVP